MAYKAALGLSEILVGVLPAVPSFDLQATFARLSAERPSRPTRTAQHSECSNGHGPRFWQNLWQMVLRAGVEVALCLVELRGFEPLTPCMPYTACPGERRCSEPSPLVKARAQLSAGHRCCPLLPPASCPRHAPRAPLRVQPGETGRPPTEAVASPSADRPAPRRRTRRPRTGRRTSATLR